MKKLLFTPLAESDLDGILSFIAEDRPQTASQVIARIKSKCELIATHPHIGQARPEFPGDYRSFPVQRWVIFYCVTAEAVQIHRVLDGGRDIDSLFSIGN